MIKHVAFVLLLILGLSVALPAKASVCRNCDNHRICILSIKRSAKNYWEYRAAISFDGIKTPIEVYNCRSEVKIQQDGTVQVNLALFLLRSEHAPRNKEREA